jgi:hypothetical protein
MPLSAPSTTTTTAVSPALVDHWKNEVKVFTDRKAKADKAVKDAAAELLTKKDELSAEDTVLTALVKAIADVRAALAAAGPADAPGLVKTLSALLVRQRDAEARRLQAARAMDGAQVESDVAADRLADAAAGLGAATAALTAAEAAHKLRVERGAKLEGEEFTAAVVRTVEEVDIQRKKAADRLKVIPSSLQASAQQGYKAEVDALEASAQKAREEAGKLATTDPVEAAAIQLADAEAKVRERLESTLPEMARATALLKKVAGEKTDPPLLSKEEQASFEPESGAAAARGASRGGGAGADPAELERIANEKARAYEETLARKKQGAQPGEEVERDPDVVHARTELMQAAQAYERALQAGGAAGPGGGASVTKAELIALGRAVNDTARKYEGALADARKKAKPGEDPEADPAVVRARKERDEATTAYEKAVKGFEPPPESRLPDKAWQALLDVRQAESILARVSGGPSSVDLIKKVDEAQKKLAQVKADAANGRRDTEDKKYEARRAAKLYEKARAAHESRLLSAVRGDF